MQTNEKLLEITKIKNPLDRVISIMERLRSPDGCPWDREQTFDTIKKYTLEEVYEVFDAIERRSWGDLKDELGDLFLQVLFYSQMATEAGYFSIADVAENLSEKLIRRHPHVFGDESANDKESILRNWEQIKREEKMFTQEEGQQKGLLDQIPRTMPAALEAKKIGSQAAKVGFDWPDANGLFEKLQEEINELKVELSSSPQNSSRVEAELGDLLFTAINLARHIHIDPESALRSANAKFRHRFAYMEKSAGSSIMLEKLSASELNDLWTKAKNQEER